MTKQTPAQEPQEPQAPAAIPTDPPPATWQPVPDVEITDTWAVEAPGEEVGEELPQREPVGFAATYDDLIPLDLELDSLNRMLHELRAFDALARRRMLRFLYDRVIHNEALSEM